MMMPKQGLLWVMVLLCYLPVLAQTGMTLDEKYWHYRARLAGDGTTENPGFLATGEDKDCPDGDCAGYNLPMQLRNPWVRNGLIEWADATIMLGWYMALLATEWEVLHRQGQSTTATEKDLYFAMKALNRLDRHAETLYGDSGLVNGYFVRDDVPWNLKNKFPGYNYLYSGQNLFNCYKDPNCTGISDEVYEHCHNINLGFINLNPKEPVKSAMSGDQVIAIMTGLACIARFIPEQTVYREMNFIGECRAMTDRIITYMKTKGWFLKDPNNDLVCRGAHQFGIMYAFVKAAKFITGKNYMDWYAGTVGRFFWKTAALEFRLDPGNAISFHIPLPTKYLNLDFFKEYRKEILFLQINQDAISPGIDWTEVNLHNILQLAATSDTWSKNNLAQNAYYTDMQIFDLLHSALYQVESPVFFRSYWVDLLDSAPENGPCYFDKTYVSADGSRPFKDADCTPVKGWQYYNRFYTPSKALNGPRTHARYGEYNGIDYMLSYNLFRIVYQP